MSTRDMSLAKSCEANVKSLIERGEVKGKKKPQRLFVASNKGRVSEVNGGNVEFYGRCCKVNEGYP